MRGALALALLIATPTKPPVIHETFTLLPCPSHPVSTLDYEGCLEHQIVRTDRQINTLANGIFYKLAASERAGFVRGEHSWLAYRRANCAAEASKYSGGTAAPLLYASCTVARNKTHISDLTELKKTLATP